MKFTRLFATSIASLDGGGHFEDAHEKRDAQRDLYLESEGYRVLRFSKLDLISNRNGVLERIAEAVQAVSPFPANGGEGPDSESVS